MIYPFFQAVDYTDPEKIFSLFAAENAALWLDTAQVCAHRGQFSFIAVDPFATLSSKNGVIYFNNTKFAGNPFDFLRAQLSQYQLATLPDLPPFQGGVAGLFAYDLLHHLEKLSVSAIDDKHFPDLALGFYDLVIGFDHIKQTAWVFSSGLPLTDDARVGWAKKRLAWLTQRILTASPTKIRTFQCLKHRDIQSNCTESTYKNAVHRVKEYILAGDIFEANISQRFQASLSNDIQPYAIYQRLRLKNPAPFGAYFTFNDMVIASASPERFLKLSSNHIETRPIKGTRIRHPDPIADAASAKTLSQSAKDISENIMIVDLLRNDLSRVCEDHSVLVPQLCGLESYAEVHHLVSVVIGKLQTHYTVIDLLCAAFPGGSITGAPKIRAMEIIEEIERVKRGPYCGSMGYIGFNGDMDTSIIIRTYAIKHHQLTFQAGGAIVLESDPADEYYETLIKAKALHSVLYDSSY